MLTNFMAGVIIVFQMEPNDLKFRAEYIANVHGMTVEKNSDTYEFFFDGNLLLTVSAPLMKSHLAKVSKRSPTLPKDRRWERNLTLYAENKINSDTMRAINFVFRNLNIPKNIVTLGGAWFIKS